MMGNESCFLNTHFSKFAMRPERHSPEKVEVTHE